MGAIGVVFGLFILAHSSVQAFSKGELFGGFVCLAVSMLCVVSLIMTIKNQD